MSRGSPKADAKPLNPSRAHFVTETEAADHAERDGLWPFLEASFLGYSGYSRLTADEWIKIEASYGGELCEAVRKAIDGLLREGAETEEHRRRPYRLAHVQDRVEDLHLAVADLLDSLDLPKTIGVASGIDLLCQPPRSISLASSITPGGDAWQRLHGAAILGDGKTRQALSLIDNPEDALQVIWAFGHAAWQVQRRWSRDRGGKKQSMDKEIITKMRLYLIKYGHSDAFTWDDVKSEMSGPFWKLTHELWKLRPDSFATRQIPTLLSRVKSSGSVRRRRTKPRQ